MSAATVEVGWIDEAGDGRLEKIGCPNRALANEVLHLVSQVGDFEKIVYTCVKSEGNLFESFYGDTALRQLMDCELGS